jgi:translation initiation factor 4G
MASSGSAGPQFGPNSVFNKKKTGGAITPPTLSRQASTTNMFSALGDETGAAPADRRTSADAGEGNAGPQRKKLNLKPRSVPMPGDEENAGDEDKEDEEDDEEEEEEQEETAAAAPTAMSADKAKTKIDSDMKELWGEKDAGGSRNPDDVVEYFKALPQEHKPLLVTRLVEDIFRLSKYKDAEVVAKGWKQALEEDAVSKAMLVDA